MSGTEAEEDGKKEAERTKAEENFAVIIVELTAVPGKGMTQGTQRRRAVHVPGMVWAAILGSGTASPKHVWMLRRKPSPTTMTLATPTATFAEATGATERRRFGRALNFTEKTPAPSTEKRRATAREEKITTARQPEMPAGHVMWMVDTCMKRQPQRTNVAVTTTTTMRGVTRTTPVQHTLSNGREPPHALMISIAMVAVRAAPLLTECQLLLWMPCDRAAQTDTTTIFLA